MIKENYTDESWAEFESAKAEMSETALIHAIDGLEYKPDTKDKVDKISNKMLGNFNGQNDSYGHALTIHLDKDTRDIDIYVYDVGAGLGFSVLEVGMKTAFTTEPIMGITSQMGFHVELDDEEGNRDEDSIIAAAEKIGDAMAKQFGIHILHPLSTILRLPENDRSMDFLFSCGTSEEDLEYSMIYTLHFKPAPVYFAEKPVEYDMSVPILLYGKDMKLEVVTNVEKSKLKWTSSNEAVAKVDDQGNVTCVNEGYAFIYVTFDGNPAPAAKRQVRVMKVDPIPATSELENIEERNSEETGDTEILVPPTEEPTE